MMYEEYTCSVIKHLISRGGQLIDVRPTLEYVQGSLAGADNMPVETITYLLPSLDINLPVLVFSKTGEDSERVKKYLQSQGYEQAHNIGTYLKYKDCLKTEKQVSA